MDRMHLTYPCKMYAFFPATRKEEHNYSHGKVDSDDLELLGGKLHTYKLGVWSQFEQDIPQELMRDYLEANPDHKTKRDKLLQKAN